MWKTIYWTMREKERERRPWRHWASEEWDGNWGKNHDFVSTTDSDIRRPIGETTNQSIDQWRGQARVWCLSWPDDEFFGRMHAEYSLTEYRALCRHWSMLVVGVMSEASCFTSSLSLSASDCNSHLSRRSLHVFWISCNIRTLVGLAWMGSMGL